MEFKVPSDATFIAGSGTEVTFPSYFTLLHVDFINDVVKRPDRDELIIGAGISRSKQQEVMILTGGGAVLTTPASGSRIIVCRPTTWYPTQDKGPVGRHVMFIVDDPQSTVIVVPSIEVIQRAKSVGLVLEL